MSLFSLITFLCTVKMQNYLPFILTSKSFLGPQRRNLKRASNDSEHSLNKTSNTSKNISKKSKAGSPTNKYLSTVVKTSKNMCTSVKSSSLVSVFSSNQGQAPKLLEEVQAWRNVRFVSKFIS